MLTTQTLNLFRNDFADAANIAEGAVTMPCWDHIRSVSAEEARQMVVYLKPTHGFPIATAVNEGQPNPTEIRSAGAQLTLTQLRRGLKTKYTIEAQSFDPYNKIGELGELMGASLGERKEMDACDVLLNNAFDATNYPIATGKALYDDDHSIGDITLDNLDSSASLTASTVESLLVKLASQKGPRNMTKPYTKKMKLLVPPALGYTARTIQESQHLPGVADNDKNVIRDQFEVMVTPFATSTVAYAMIPADPKDMDVWKAVNTNSENGIDQDEDGMVKMARWAIYDIGARTPFNMVGNDGGS